MPFGDGNDELIRSVMEQHPEFVHLIGMITIELANVESSLADLLAAVLEVAADVGHAIYFTPKAVIPRVEVLMNVQKALHPDDHLDPDEMRDIRRKLKNVCERAVAVMGKRNSLLHAMWGTDGQKGVRYSSLPLQKYGFRSTEIVDLETIVSDMRRLIGDIKYLQLLVDAYRNDEELFTEPAVAEA